jgi:hypothetical protein
MNSLISNNFNNEFIGRKNIKKNYSFYFVGISIDKDNISPTEKSYVIS